MRFFRIPYCPLRAEILTPKGSHMSAGGQRSATPGYELKLFSFPERDTYRRLPQIRYNQEKICDGFRCKRWDRLVKNSLSLGQQVLVKQSGFKEKSHHPTAEMMAFCISENFSKLRLCCSRFGSRTDNGSTPQARLLPSAPGPLQ